MYVQHGYYYITDINKSLIATITINNIFYYNNYVTLIVLYDLFKICSKLHIFVEISPTVKTCINAHLNDLKQCILNVIKFCCSLNIPSQSCYVF